ncbi:hypothetical protein HU200_017307 [Digitaria exilis]|uniref:Uncharacterized protein n=1 Tax=Digitaria exilis TaxID=1010633 RepID=A0A835F6H0_9POAL|nr:hypothetical protein HU200_017307 [Digitaria exilis]
MELITPPPQEFLSGSTATAAAAFTPNSAIMNPFASADDMASGNPFLATAVTAPPSPNPFEHLPPGASDADPFDLFQHFTSAPASPARAAAIYAQFDGVVDGKVVGAEEDDDDAGFQPRVSYSTVGSTVPFEWEEKPGKPKAEFTYTVVEGGDGEVDDDTDFDFGVLLDKATQAQELTTADELFDEGKIRPLKPPPRLLDGGSVGSSPRSARSVVMWSPRLRRSVRPGSANDFDPFAAALAKAANAPSPLGLGAGSKDDDSSNAVESDSSPENPADSAMMATSDPPTTTTNGRRKKWRLSDLLLFRRVSGKGHAGGGNISRDPVFKYAPVQQLGTPMKTASAAGPAAAGGDVSSGKHKKQSKKTSPEGGMAMPHRQSMMGCVRLHPGLHRLAKGFHGHSAAHLGGRGTARSAMKG